MTHQQGGHAPRDTRIERWLQGRSEGPPRPDRSRVLRGALSTIPTTRQRRRRWHLAWMRPTDDAARGIEGEQTTMNWRFTTMSATKILSAIAIVSVAAVATAGGLRTVQTGSDVGPPVISLAVEAGPATFSGTIDMADLALDETIDPYEWPDGSTSTGRRQEGGVVETNESRFGGLATSEFYNVFQGDVGYTGMFWGMMRVDDDEGAWVGPTTGAGAPARSFDVQSMLIGEGAYEGLYAIIFMRGGPTGVFDLRGTILVGSPPPVGEVLPLD